MSSKEESSRLLTSSVHEDGHRSVSNGFCGRVVDSLLAFRRKRIITVEVAVFLYCFSMYMTNLVSQQFMYQYFEVHYLRKLGYGNFSISGMCINPKLQFESCGDDQTTVQHCVQRDTSYLIRNLTIATTIIMSVTTLFIGPLTDKVGRKFALVLAALGNIVSFVLSLLVIYLQLPIRPMVIVAGVINGATGGLASTLVGAYTYISDISTNRYRTLRLGLIVAMMFISGGIGQYVCGVWLYHNNCTYEHLFWFAVSVNALEVLFVLFGFPESRTSTTQDASQTVIKKPCNCSFCNPKDCLEVLKVSLIKFFKGFRIFLRFQLVTVELWLALLASMLYVMNSVGIETITTAFLKGYPLFWNSENLGTYNAMIFGLSGGFVVILLPILSVLLKLPDPLIALLSTVPAVMAYFMVAYLGPTLTTWKMYLRKFV